MHTKADLWLIGGSGGWLVHQEKGLAGAKMVLGRVAEELV